MDISIIIVSWNTKDILLKCLQSLEQETKCLLTEIIVVDNCSTDGSPEAVKIAFPEVKLIKNTSNLGFAKANNIGILNSSGRYICLVNSDVIVQKECFKPILEYMDDHPEIGILGPQVLNPDHTIQNSCRRFPTLQNSLFGAFALQRIFQHSHLAGEFNSNALPQDRPSNIDVIYGCFWMVNGKALDSVGLLDDEFFIFGEDIDWCKRFWEAGYRVVYFPLVSVIHYSGASSSNSPVKFYIEMQRARLQYWEKHSNFETYACSWLIMFAHHLLRLLPFLFIYFIRPSNKKSALKFEKSIGTVFFLFKNISKRIKK